MKKIFLLFVIIAFMFLSATYGYGEYVKFDIKYGMHEKIVSQKYGDPVLVKDIKVHPIPRKKALYKLGESDYMELYFFSGRIYKIVLLEDMGFKEAASVFKKE